MKYEITDKQKEYLRKVYGILFVGVSNHTKPINAFKYVGYQEQMEFINRVLGDLFYTGEDRGKLNELSKVYREGVG
jgi:hypothetical protein